MKIEELERYRLGQDLISKQHKVSKQLEVLKNCNIVKIFDSTDSINPTQFVFEKSNPFYPECEKFMEQYKLYLLEKLNKLKIEFNDI